MKKIRIAQIGSGHDHATATWGSINRLSDIFDIAGYYLPEEEKELFPHKLEAFAHAKELTLEEILNDPTITAVVVETQEVSLTKYSLLCAQHGKHVQMDKPGGIDADLFETLVRTMKEKNLVFHLGYMYRYNEAVMDLMDRIERGELGEIYCVETHMDCRHKPEKRQWLSTFPGGMLFFLGCHLIDLIFRIQGMPEKILPLSTCTGCSAPECVPRRMSAPASANACAIWRCSSVGGVAPTFPQLSDTTTTCAPACFMAVISAVICASSSGA